MPTWNPRSLPYPLLAPWTDDYVGHVFNVSVPDAILNNGEQITLTLKYHVTSESLLALIKDEKAKYVTLTACALTGQRDVITTKYDEEIGVLNAGDYMKSVTLLSYIVASTSLAGWKSTEYSHEFSQFRPEGFDLLAGSILAAADEMRIDLDESASPFSIIDLVQDSRVKNGEFRLGFDDVRIKIHLSPKDKTRIEALRKQGPTSQGMMTLFPALYLHAIAEALRRLSDCQAQWTGSLRRALEKKNIVVDDQALSDDPIRYAQELLDRPLGPMLTAFEKADED